VALTLAVVCDGIVLSIRITVAAQAGIDASC
jgi:hypothetical protein